MTRRFCFSSLLMLALGFFTPLSLSHAQTAVDGAIGGTVLDTTGAAVSGATVTARSNATNAEQATTSDASGYFRIIHLQPGAYSVTLTAPGFETFRSVDLTVQVGLLTNVDANLKVGTSSQTVEVSGTSPLLNTVSPDFASVIEQRTLHNLPVSNYRWSSYALLTPGVLNDSNGFGLLSFRGQSTLLNNITIDGTDDNQAYFSEERGRTRAGYSTAKSAIQEFQVNTSNYSVEYGRSAGGIVNSVTKSGSNTFHGEAYLFYRDNDWAATNSSVVHAVQLPGTTGYTVVPFKPTDVRRQYGFSVGGPIWKDRIFFFFAADKFYHDFPGTAAIASASANANFFNPADSTLPEGKTCGGTSSALPSFQDTQVCQISKLTGLPYGGAGTSAYSVYTSGISGLNTMLGTTPRTGDQTIYFPRIDWQVNQKNHASVEANRMRWTSPAGIQTAPAVAYGRASFGNDYVRDTWLVAKLDTFFTPSLSNQLRYMYGRDFEFETNQSPTSYETNNLISTPNYTNPLGLPPNVFLSGFFQFGTPTFLLRPALPDERRWQIADTVEWLHGNHNFKFGGDYIHTTDLINNLFDEFGGYSYTGSTLIGNYISDSYLAGLNEKAQNYSNYTQGAGVPGLTFTTGDYSLFAQDTWQANRRLSVTLGLRYEYERFPDPQLPNPAVPQTVSLPTDKTNFGPRVGFAYDVYGSGKMVVRGGYGMFFARAINSTLYQAIVATGAPGSQTNPTLLPGHACAPSFPQVVAPENQAACLGGSNATVYFLDRNFKVPQIHQADLTVQQQITNNDAFSISWLATWGRRLPDFVDTNLPAPVAVDFTVVDPTHEGPLANGTTFAANAFLGKRPNPNFSSMTNIFSGVNSNYQALVAQYTHRFSRFASLDANYTWSHALDYGVNNQTGAAVTSLLDPTNLRLDYGNSMQNVPNRFVLYAVADSFWHVSGPWGYLLNDYQLSPSFAAQTGLPYSTGISGASSTLTVTPGEPVQSIITTSSFNGSGGANRVPIVNRNNHQQPNTWVLDLRASKRFVFHEKYTFEFLAEAFNLANHQNVTSVNSSAYFVNNNTTKVNGVTIGEGNTLTPFSTPFAAVATTNNSNFAYNVRQIQLGGRFTF